ncbi:MAG: glycogen/starch/alpha-glucan phosphorylase [Oscillospiraceae bacterium]
MKQYLTAQTAARLIEKKLTEEISVRPDAASDEQFYRAVALTVRDILEEKHRSFAVNELSHGKKKVHYLSMEFLPGRSLKNSLYNLGLADTFGEALASMQVSLERLYEYEPDAGLGNGGLGRLAACYLDGLATDGFCATGYSILYEYGIFRQKIVDGWQIELPDYWIPGGEVWLAPRPDQATEVRFGGKVNEWWEGELHRIEHTGYTTVTAVPYDLMVSGYDTDAVSVLRLYKAQKPGVDMEKFNNGDYLGAFGATSVAETISKVLYPNDSHLEGKKLRLRQQYFLSAAAVGDIIRRHLTAYGSLDSLPEKNAIQINDTHPVLAIPEMMRVLLDDCGADWDRAYDFCCRTFSYTHHTVMAEALEQWDEELLREMLPRIHQIIREINERFCRDLRERSGCSDAQIARMAPIAYKTVRMANLAVAVCHSVNGVSKLHSELVKADVFPDYARVAPYKFKNVTNGIASRRWLLQSNPGLTALLEQTIGPGFKKQPELLEGFRAFADDPAVLERVLAVKRENKERLSQYLQKHTGTALNPDAIFDVQVKRLHEYKRQQMKALSIIADYQLLREHPEAEVTPRIHLFGAKAAPGYFLAKQIIKLLCTLSKTLDADPLVAGRLRVVYLEDYKVTLSELLMPAADFSQQISQAGTEASGTGNMKLMLGGAVTIGTWDGANIEITEAAGEENEIIFGMRADEVQRLRAEGYDPCRTADADPVLHRALEALITGELGDTFRELYDALRYTDRYMTLADFGAYRAAMERSEALWRDRPAFARASLLNTAASGVFAADRAVMDYARSIWGLVD